MNENTFAVLGDVCYSISPDELITAQNAYVVCDGGKCAGVFEKLPERYSDIPVIDMSGKLLTPGFVDLHLHAPQYSYRGTGMDLELLEWLESITFPEEAGYADTEYAIRAYRIFTDDLKRSPTTRACVFATIHADATLELMRMLDECGMAAYVGKVNMDRNSPDNYRETTRGSLEETEKWLKSCEQAGFLAEDSRVRPIITPRFVPSCTDELMRGLGKLAASHGLAVQSHLSENISEVEWVSELAPDAAGYADAYDRFGLFGGDVKTVMAHCIYLRDDEMELMRQRGVFAAHSPQSNMNLRSGIAPMRKLLERGIKCGLASDLAGGSSINMFKAVTDAIQVSKLYWRLIDDTKAPLSFRESFYLATKGGGEFFTKTGSFEKGYEFDLLAIDDSMAATPLKFGIVERLERTMYLGHAGFIKAKFVAGRRII